jgi:signal transduction histidine kinase
VYARKTGNQYLVMDAYEVLSDVYEEEGRFKDALAFHKLFSSLRDSIHEKENTTASEELEVRYQNTKKQSEIELLQKDQQIKTIALRQQRITQTALGMAIVLILMIGFLLFNRYRILQESRRNLDVERVRNQLARDLHDDIGSALSSINIISQIAIQESGPASGLFQRIADQSAKMMENMSDMVWSINPGNDALEKIVVRMKEFAAEILEPKNIAYHFTGDESANDIVLDVEKRKNLFLIFKEAINNSAKYSAGTSIEIQLKLTRGRLEMRIRDNGKGFEPSQEKKGNGLRNMQQRAAEMKGQLTFEPAPGGGTCVVLAIPIA